MSKIIMNIFILAVEFIVPFFILFLLFFPPVTSLSQGTKELTKTDTIIVDSVSISPKSIQLVEEAKTITGQIKSDIKDVKEMAKTVERETKRQRDNEKIAQNKYELNSEIKSDTTKTETIDNRSFIKKLFGIDKPKSK